MLSDITKKLQHFFSHLYLRYLLVTELYMVEPWEKVVIHVLFVVAFSGFWYFNYRIVYGGIAQMMDNKVSMEKVL